MGKGTIIKQVSDKIIHLIDGEILLDFPFNYYKMLLIRIISAAYRRYIKYDTANVCIPIRFINEKNVTDVDEYWNEHTVNSIPFSTRWESDQYYHWMVQEYPLLDKLMEFSADLSGCNVLDYGCGPGNDIYRLLVRNKAKKVIGIDISRKALEVARKRIALYKVFPAKLDLIQIVDSCVKLPIEDGVVDYVNCVGVLHHVTNPEPILTEFSRILKQGAYGHIMVYNEDSIFYHLCVAYIYMIINRKYEGMDIKDVFTRSTDGDRCPISRCYNYEDFTALCQRCGLAAEYQGGYFNRSELKLFRKFAGKAIHDKRLDTVHRKFLNDLHKDCSEFPLYHNKYAGIGGVYRIKKQ